ncbi:MAG: hypothetical protein WCA00_04500 [Candidatus Acidiferrales bacterium]
MKSLAKRMVKVVVGVAIAAFLLTLAAPKAAHAIVSTLVTVANTAANPVPVDTTADGRASIALVSSQQLNAPAISGLQAFLNVTDFSTFIVPAGKRFMIDEVSAQVQIEPGGQPLVIMEINQGSGHLYQSYIPLTLVPVATTDTQLNLNAYAAMEKVSLFVDPGGPFEIYFMSETPNSSANANVYVIGHLIDCGSGCAGQ